VAADLGARLALGDAATAALVDAVATPLRALDL